MPLVNEVAGKPSKAKDSSVSQYHQQKQKGMSYWVGQRALDDRSNPDVYVLGGHLVVRLNNVDDDHDADTLAGPDNYILKSKDTHYYGVVVPGPLDA